MASADTEPKQETGNKALLIGLMALSLAIGVAATVSREAGGLLLIASWALLLRSIHKLGRSGPA